MAHYYGPLSVLYTKLENAYSVLVGSDKNEAEKPRVMVVGYGWAASAFVHNVNRKKYHVDVISSTPARFSQPTLISSWKKNFKPPPTGLSVISDEAVSAANGVLSCKSGSYSFDYLVVATGAEPNDFGIPGVKENSHFFKFPAHLDALQARLTQPTTVSIMGAGPTGLELAFKLSSMGHKAVVVEAAGSILPGFSEGVKSRVLAEADRKGVQLFLGHQILGVTPAAIKTSQGDVPIGETGVAVWTCGVRPTAFGRQFPPADGQLRSGGGDSPVFLIGDAARGRGPPTAQNAKRQGEYLAHFFNAGLPKDHPPYKFDELARVVDIGDKLVVGRDNFAFEVPGSARHLLYAMLD